MATTSLISGKAKNIKQVFDRLLANNLDIKGVILLSYEGLVMVSSLETGALEESISAMTAGINFSISRYLKGFQWNSFSDIVITGSKDDKKTKIKEHIVVKDIKDNGLLVVLTKPNVDWEKLYSHVNYIVSTICYPGEANRSSNVI